MWREANMLDSTTTMFQVPGLNAQPNLDEELVEYRINQKHFINHKNSTSSAKANDPSFDSVEVQNKKIKLHKEHGVVTENLATLLEQEESRLPSFKTTREASIEEEQNTTNKELEQSSGDKTSDFLVSTNPQESPNIQMISAEKTPKRIDVVETIVDVKKVFRQVFLEDNTLPPIGANTTENLMKLLSEISNNSFEDESALEAIREASEGLISSIVKPRLVIQSNNETNGPKSSENINAELEVARNQTLASPIDMNTTNEAIEEPEQKAEESSIFNDKVVNEEVKSVNVIEKHFGAGSNNSSVPLDVEVKKKNFKVFEELETFTASNSRNGLVEHPRVEKRQESSNGLQESSNLENPSVPGSIPAPFLPNRQGYPTNSVPDTRLQKVDGNVGSNDGGNVQQSAVVPPQQQNAALMQPIKLEPIQPNVPPSLQRKLEPIPPNTVPIQQAPARNGPNPAAMQSIEAPIQENSAILKQTAAEKNGMPPGNAIPQLPTMQEVQKAQQGAVNPPNAREDSLAQNNMRVPQGQTDARIKNIGTSALQAQSQSDPLTMAIKDDSDGGNQNTNNSHLGTDVAENKVGDAQNSRKKRHANEDKSGGKTVSKTVMELHESGMKKHFAKNVKDLPDEIREQIELQFSSTPDLMQQIDEEMRKVDKDIRRKVMVNPIGEQETSSSVSTLAHKDDLHRRIVCFLITIDGILFILTIYCCCRALQLLVTSDEVLKNRSTESKGHQKHSGLNSRTTSNLSDQTYVDSNGNAGQSSHTDVLNSVQGSSLHSEFSNVDNQSELKMTNLDKVLEKRPGPKELMASGSRFQEDSTHQSASDQNRFNNVGKGKDSHQSFLSDATTAESKPETCEVDMSYGHNADREKEYRVNIYSNDIADVIAENCGLDIFGLPKMDEATTKKQTLSTGNKALDNMLFDKSWENSLSREQGIILLDGAKHDSFIANEEPQYRNSNDSNALRQSQARSITRKE